MKHKTRYGEISKIDAEEDGTLKVWGVASSESEDSDGETITAAAMKAALPDYMRFGAVREMHQPKASLRQLQDERDKLKQQLAKLAAEPATTPAVLKAITKGDDLGDPASNKPRRRFRC